MADERDPCVRLGAKEVGPGRPIYLIAEAGVNHGGDLRTARRMIDVAAAARVDAVKFQAFRPDDLCAREAPLAAYAKGAAASQRELLRGLALAPRDLAELCEYARSAGLEFLCTPFDRASLELLFELDLAAYKFASTDLPSQDLLALAAAGGRPLLLSTGASTPEEVERALEPLASRPVLLLHCISAYPTPIEEARLSTIRAYERRFGRAVGFSDHTPGVTAGALAAAAGARLIEKHFTLDPAAPGPDQAMSLAPAELARFVESIRQAERAMGKPREQVLPIEADVRAQARKSLVTVRALAAGATIREDDLTEKRPGTGISPAERGSVVGRRVLVAIPADTVLTWEMLTGPGG